MKKLPVLFFFLFCGLLKLFSTDGDILPVAEKLTEKLGWTLNDAINLGVPKELFVHRGDSPIEDNVVFYYPDYLYLFWFQNRIWQVRLDERWGGEIDGVRMGMSLQDIEELWGSPINKTEEHPTWTLPDKGFPSRIRLYFRDDKLSDLYVFRSDW